MLALTPNFQNPTGTTLPAEARKTILEMVQRSGVVIVENDLYGELRYHGAEIPSIKRLDGSGDAILLGSFSKIAFPGLRVGWAIGPRHFIARLTEAKGGAICTRINFRRQCCYVSRNRDAWKRIVKRCSRQGRSG